MKTYARFLATGSVLLMLALSGGCSSVENDEGAGPGVRVRDPRAPNAQNRLNSVVILDDSLERWETDKGFFSWLFGDDGVKRGKIAVEGTGARRTPTRSLEVWAQLRNRTDFPLQIEARTQFFDRDEAPIEGPSAWKRIYLPANSTAPYREVSLGVDNREFYIVEIREGR